MNCVVVASKYWTHDLSPFLWEFPGEFANWDMGESDGTASPTYLVLYQPIFY